MTTFNVYPKEGDKFPVECERIEPTTNGFVLYDSAKKPSKEAFLSFNQIAAIIPGTRAEKGKICFRVYLRNKPEYFEVFAHAFDTEPKIAFHNQRKDGAGNLIDQWEIEGFYINPSELIAIVPSDGLPSFRR